jgi:hypothetical protein
MKVWLVSVLKESSMNVAQTILQQLGGRRFLAMTGAKFMVGDKQSLMFALPKCKDGINKVRVSLNASDTYDLDFFRLRGTQVTQIARVEDVYNDQLQEIFTQYTGLDTSL